MSNRVARARRREREAGRVPEAKAQFEAALRVMPDYAPARQNLSVIEPRRPKGAVPARRENGGGAGA